MSRVMNECIVTIAKIAAIWHQKSMTIEIHKCFMCRIDSLAISMHACVLLLHIMSKQAAKTHELQALSYAECTIVFSNAIEIYI